MTAIASPEQLEKIGALAAKLVKSGERVGLGSGRAALAFVRALGARVKAEGISIIGVPTSLLTEKTARQAGIPLSTLEETDTLDITIDGADEVDPQLNLIKGGGGNLSREKIVTGVSKKLVIVVGGEKIVDRLGTSFPVFVEAIEFARPVVVRKLKAMGAEVTQRMNKDGSVFLTDNLNPYFHAKFPAEVLSRDPAGIDAAIRRMPGVVETGLFIGIAEEVIVAHADGRVEHKRRK